MELPVIITHVIFKNDNGWAVLSANLDVYSDKYKPEMEDIVKEYLNPKYNSFTVTTSMFDPTEEPRGGQYVFVGEFIKDKKFGNQFKSDFYFQDQPTTDDGLKAFLQSLPNIKQSRSAAILDKFGVEGTIEILNGNIYRLTEINGINEKRIPAIQKAWDEKKHMRELYTFLIEHKISFSIADKAYKKWGKLALSVIKENPYNLTELQGIGFLTADGIAHKVLKDIDINQRLLSCLKYVLEDSFFKNSDLCVPYILLKKRVVVVLEDCDKSLNKKESRAEEYIKVIPSVLKNNLNYFTFVKDIKDNNTVYIYLAKVWEKESFIGKSIWERKKFNHAMENKECSEKDIESAEREISNFIGKKITLDETQKQAIKSAFEHKITVITGPGGSGKSAISRCIYTIARSRNLSVRMMSPTGKAAQVLTEKTNCPASTIHRSLKMKQGDDNPREEIKEDIILIDEISMCGIDTMWAVMSALQTNPYANLILVGDKNQLPSVSPGNFLSDIMESQCANVVTLDKIHRQDENSFIPIIANDISRGKSVTIPDEASDIKWHDISYSTFHSDLMEHVQKYLDTGNSINDLQILSPMKKGDCGVYKINELMQEKMATINGTLASFIKVGFQKFYIGDRVLQVENNYEKNVFNGDMGTVVKVGEKSSSPTESDKLEKFISVDFDGKVYDYFGKEIEELLLAWVCTIHKYQGSQCKNIIFIMANEAQIMVSKELCYTGLTRAEKHVDIFGNENMLRIAPTKSVIRKRFTNLKKIIDEMRTNCKIFEVIKAQKLEKLEKEKVNECDSRIKF